MRKGGRGSDEWQGVKSLNIFIFVSFCVAENVQFQNLVIIAIVQPTNCLVTGSVTAVVTSIFLRGVHAGKEGKRREEQGKENAQTK